MWRFIMITFAFLGWAFYELSGGADYEPGAHSIQARAKLNNVRPLARPVPEVPDEAAVAEATIDDTATPVDGDTPAEDEIVARALPTLDDVDLPEDGGVQLALASVTASDSGNDTATEVTAAAAGAAIAAPAPADAATSLDIRRVTGTVVNMRDGPSTFYMVVGQLREGAMVEVIDRSEDGWLKVVAPDSAQEGWMADWLLTAAN